MLLGTIFILMRHITKRANQGYECLTHTQKGGKGLFTGKTKTKRKLHLSANLALLFNLPSFVSRQTMAEEIREGNGRASATSVGAKCTCHELPWSYVGKQNICGQKPKSWPPVDIQPLSHIMASPEQLPSAALQEGSPSKGLLGIPRWDPSSPEV